MISIIAAIGKNRELGKDNKLLWRIPEDMKRFKDLTLGQVVIMGRKTYESLPKKFRPLPNRINIVISRHPELVSGSQQDVETCLPSGRQVRHNINTIICFSIEQAIDKAKEFNKEIFIIGGASIYSQGLKYADKLYLTLVDKEYPDADVFFPDYKDFGKVKFLSSGFSGNLKYQFIEVLKNNT
jgi:dihydrofolate reductase